MRLSLGVEPGIVAARTETAARRSGGPTTVRLTVANRLGVAVEVEVVEPLASGRRLTTVTRGGAQQGDVVAWLLELKPRETRDLLIRHVGRRPAPKR